MTFHNPAAITYSCTKQRTFNIKYFALDIDALDVVLVNELSDNNKAFNSHIIMLINTFS